MKFIAMALLATLMLLPGRTVALVLATSLEPLRLIAADIGGARVESSSLLPAGGDTHHVGLRPSEIRQLQAADLVLWVGPRMEAGLTRHIARLPERTTVITLSESVGKSKVSTHSLAATDDLHIWLDPVQAHGIAVVIAEVLGRRLPEHALEFAAALRRFEIGVRDWQEGTQLAMRPLAPRGLLVTHDAYGHFLGRFDLQQLMALRDQEDRPPGARRIARFKQLARDNAACVLADTGYALKAVRPLLTDTDANVLLLPPAGPSNQEFGSYLALMTWFADGIGACLAERN